jgi:cell division protein FtsI/penicillin-binding protein 2
MNRLIEHPPADFTSVNTAALSDLGVTRASYLAGAITESAASGTAQITEVLELAGIGDWVVHSKLALIERSGRWLVKWSPTTIDPSLTSGAHFSIETTWAARAPILGAGGVALTTQVPMVIVGLEGRYVKDPASLSAALTAAGAPSEAVHQALAAAKAHPTWFEPVFTITQARYLELKPVLYPLPGTLFQTTSERAAITPGLQAHVVGSIGPITAQELSELGAPYDATSVVGQTGLEQVYQSRLAGTPGETIKVIGANGTTEATLAAFPPKPGKPLETSIDPLVQKSAEAALAGLTKKAALVAVRASTGQVLAVVSDPGAYGFDQALDGAFAPGSTFKTVTSTALIANGLSPSSPASCPSSITAGGETFHNAEGDAPVQNLAQAFTESCNTAFIGLATAYLEDSSLPAAAALYDIGKTPAMGLAGFGGSVPTPTDQADLAASAIGQGKVLVSPLDMAMVAAAIDSGTVREPRLVAGAPDDGARTHALDPAVVRDLHEMMADVVATGTAAHTGLPAGTYAKTGTAEYATGNPPPTDAWLIGFNGDIAFAVLVVDGGYGGPTDGPIAARFLDALGRAK